MIRPIYDRVLIKREDTEETTSGGIIIPTEAQDKKANGIIVAVGKGKTTVNGFLPMSVEVGDFVYFGANAGVPVKHEGVESLDSFQLLEISNFAINEHAISGLRINGISQIAADDGPAYFSAITVSDIDVALG